MAKAIPDPASHISVKVTLRGIRPPIWRRLVIPGKSTLTDLHIAIQASMGWESQHLWFFDIGGRHYGDPSQVPDVDDEENMTLNAVRNSGVNRFSYVYDFGDNWHHTVAIEKNLPTVSHPDCPICIGGKRNCPPEDCGGLPGYEQLILALADPGGPKYRVWVDMIGEGFEPERFSVEEADYRVAARFARND